MAVSFTQHPHDIGETYGQHFGVAMSFSGAMLAAGLACAVHAVLPFLFTRTGSQTIRRLHDRMVASRAAAAHPG